MKNKIVPIPPEAVTCTAVQWHRASFPKTSRAVVCRRLVECGLRSHRMSMVSGGSRGVRSSSDEPPFFPSDQLTASNFSTPKISVLDGNRASADFISSAGA